MPRRKVLLVVHNHPRTRPGGAETYAYETYLAMRDSADLEPVLLAKGGPPLESIERLPSSTQFGPGDPSDPNQYFFYTDSSSFDWLYGTTTNKEMYTKHFHEFLAELQPDVVHFQHTLYLGYDLIRQVRNTLPGAAIVYTLHEFLPICHRQGQMVRTFGDELCDKESPRRCHECFPEVSPQTFFMRKRFVQSQFALVDCFIAPSRFLLERYVAWGVPRDRIIFEDYGRLAQTVVLDSCGSERPRDRFGFFGQLNPFKGVDVLLQAMALLGPTPRRRRLVSSTGASMRPRCHRPRPHLWLHGANLELQAGSFQTHLAGLVEDTKDRVTLVGRYEIDDLPVRMANVDWVIVPSIWWENSPLVIQEAFMHGRPVIVSDIGGMAEKVTDGVNGLHFRVGDAPDLARTIERAANTHGLWETLRSGIAPVHSMGTHLRALRDLYERILSRRTASSVA